MQNSAAGKSSRTQYATYKEVYQTGLAGWEARKSQGMHGNVHLEDHKDESQVTTSGCHFFIDHERINHILLHKQWLGHGMTCRCFICTRGRHAGDSVKVSVRKLKKRPSVSGYNSINCSRLCRATHKCGAALLQIDICCMRGPCKVKSVLKARHGSHVNGTALKCCLQFSGV